MNTHTQWDRNNTAHLEALLKWLRLRLQQHIPEQSTRPADSNSEAGHSWFRWSKDKSTQTDEPLRLSAPDQDELTQLDEQIQSLEQQTPPPALILLAQRLNLSRFEQQLLALCAAQELDTGIPHLCAQAHEDANQAYPSFALAFRVFDGPDWSALSPQNPLRFWRLIEINQPGATPLTAAALQADERIVNFIKGLNYLDDRLMSMLHPLTAPSVNPGVTNPLSEPLPASQQQSANSILDYVQSESARQHLSPVRLQGNDSDSKQAVVTSVSSVLNVNTYVLPLHLIPDSHNDLETFIRLWQRESLLLPLALYINASDASDSQIQTLQQFLQRLFQQGHGLVFIDEPSNSEDIVPRAVAFTINKPTPEEQVQLWQLALSNETDEQLIQICEQFSFNQADIKTIAANFQHSDETETESNPALWEACRLNTRAGMEQLARRIDAKATWDDIVLPEQQTGVLKQITQQIFSRKQVYSDWGFREKMNRGLGISVLFSGESGVGKTMGAEVIANACQLDLYSIDLSAVVSKYIGETEKNLRKLFDAAEDSGAILFFDEADALFGKRSEVKDSHDRYANTQIDYLLQRMEAYPGLAILATNMKSALDKAFTRRLRFIVDFPFPDHQLRQEIWQKVFPEQTPLSDEIDYARLAKLNLTGGNIHNVALNAAFLAAQQNSTITMPVILSAARTEFKKLERPTKDSDFHWSGSLEAVK